VVQDEFKKVVRKIEALEARMYTSSAFKMPDIDIHYNLCGEKLQVCT